MNKDKNMKIVVLPGDGVGPEVSAQAVKCLETLSHHCGLGLEFETHPFGGAGIDAAGSPLPDEVLEACRSADAVLLGAVGGARWDGAAEPPESGLLKLRQALGLFANLRPSKVVAGLEQWSPLRTDVARGADILVVRELTGGVYFGERRLDHSSASDLCVYSRVEIERIAHIAFQAARRRSGRVTSVDKANVMATSKLWRQTVTEVAEQYPDVALDHLYVDAAAMMLVTHPRRFDVILTENMFGDILSDELSVIGGSIGLVGSASIGAEGPGLFEPIHGSAPDIAGLDIANPSGAIASAAMMLDQLGMADMGRILEDALRSSLLGGCRTADLGGTARCSEFGEEVRHHLHRRLVRHDVHVALVTGNRGCCA